MLRGTMCKPFFALALLCSATIFLAPGAVALKFREFVKPCPEGCTRNGNCNAETGKCECPFAWTGPVCDVPVMPACHVSAPTVTGPLPMYGIQFPKNCLCLKQLQKQVCTDPRVPFDFYLCTHGTFWAWKETRCYEYKDKPPEQQFSNMPDPTDTAVTWRQGKWKSVNEGEDPFDFEQLAAAPNLTMHGRAWYPLSKCPNRCNDRGNCWSYGPGHPTQCECSAFFKGPACEEPASEHCPHSCSGRGQCRAGFCHCQPGWWGYGCLRSKAYDADEYAPHPTALRIYIYEMPEALVHMRSHSDEWPLHFPIYLAENEFFHRLLADWGTRTENPWEANLFFIPTYAYYYTGNVGFPARIFVPTVDYVRGAYPFWNLTGGRNHVLAASNDRGTCDLYKLGADVQRPIKMVHFAQSGRGAFRGRKAALSSGVNENMTLDGHPLPYFLKDRMHDDPALMSALAEYKHLDDSGRARFRGFPKFQWEALLAEKEPCYRPEHDVAFPNYLPADDHGGFPKQLKSAYNYPRNDSHDGVVRFNHDRPRPLLFSFNGFNKPDMSYSQGVRQGLAALFGNNTRPDVSLNKGGGPDLMLRSRFCFTPMGFGWGVRLTQAAFTGCIPVLTHDHVWPTLWDVLPYEKFSVRISRHNLYRLFDILEEITPEQLVGLQDGLAEWHRAFVWQPEYGGLAYNFTLQSLHRRVLNMWTALYR